MALIDRQHFLLRLLNDVTLREAFFLSDHNDFCLSAHDYSILRQLDSEAITRKSLGLARKAEGERAQEGQQV